MQAPNPSPGYAQRSLSAGQQKLIRRTVARDCTEPEFEEFITVAAQCGLDPLRRQITPLILDGGDRDRRRMICWTTIDGLRVLAARQGDYRPMETAPILETEETRVDAQLNPHGLLKAEVHAWKLRDGIWFPVAGEAWWDEHAPLCDAPAAGAADSPGPQRTLAPAWRRMGRLMLAKCAEAQALRRGWPNALSGLYGQEELHSLYMEERRQAEADRRSRKHEHLDGERRVLWFLFEPSGTFTPIKLSEVPERLCERYCRAVSLNELEWIDRANKPSLQTFWEWAPEAAFRAKVCAETCAAELAGKRSRRSTLDEITTSQDLHNDGTAT